MSKTLDKTLTEVGNSLRLMERNDQEASEREDKLSSKLAAMKQTYTEVMLPSHPQILSPAFVGVLDLL